jgi:predicted ATPase
MVDCGELVINCVVNVVKKPVMFVVGECGTGFSTLFSEIGTAGLFHIVGLSH